MPRKHAFGSSILPGASKKYMYSSDYEVFQPQWSKDKQQYHVPIDGKGNQQHYPYHYGGHGGWIDNEVFTDTLKYVTYHRGRSAAYFEFLRESTGTTVTFFMRDFENLIWLIDKGRVKGTFTFCKQGMNFGCRLAALPS